MRPSISIVIRCRNEEAHIGRLLKGIAAQTVSDVETIVVDSGSTDSTLEVASRFGPRIVSIDPDVFTFGRSLNQGCERALGEFIVIASAHVYPVRTDWLERLIEPFSRPRVALAYGKQRGNEVTKFSEHQVFASWFPDVSIPSQDHAFCNNANAAIRRSLWETERYDELLPGLEDVDWARRIMRRGFEISYAAEAEVVHVHEESYAQVRRRYFREARALAEIDPDARLSASECIRQFVNHLLSDGLAAHRDAKLYSEWRDILAFRYMQFSGAHAAFRHHVAKCGLKKRLYGTRSSFRGEQTAYHPERIGSLIDYEGRDDRGGESTLSAAA